MQNTYHFTFGSIAAKVKAKSPQVAVQLLKLSLADGKSIAGVVIGVESIQVDTAAITEAAITKVEPHSEDPAPMGLFDFDESAGASGDIARLFA